MENMKISNDINKNTNKMLWRIPNMLITPPTMNYHSWMDLNHSMEMYVSRQLQKHERTRQHLVDHSDNAINDGARSDT